jgi:RHS repeat-associated protein
MGDITAIGNSSGANPATETYSYDPLYRLTAITEANGSTLESATYNQTGDRQTKTGNGLATGAYSYNANTHQLIATGNAARAVDADGNTTAISQAGSAYGFGYSARNRMMVVQVNQSTVATYTYNFSGERVLKVLGASTERYGYGAGSRLLSEYGATDRDYVYLDGIPVANLDTQGTTTSISYVTADQVGTPRAVADGSGNTIWSWAYQGNAWGEQQPTSSGYTYNLRFPGQYYDAETGLNYNVNRTYDPSTGRYIESDPLGLLAGPSTYTYVGSNPLRHKDRLGLQEADEDENDADQLRDILNPPLGPNQADPANNNTMQQELRDGVCLAPGATPPPQLPSLLPEIPLFRAVSPAELSDIENSGTFNDPFGNGIKYFSTTDEGAASYAQQASNAFGDGPFTLVQTSIPGSLLTPDMSPQNGVDGGIPTVVIPGNLFPYLAPPIVIPYMPIPGK